MKFLRGLARTFLLILLVVLMISCTSVPTCNDEGSGAAARSIFRRPAAVGACPNNGGGGGGGNMCNSQLSPSSVVFGVDATGKFEQWEIGAMADLFLTCNTGQAAIGQTVTAAGKYVYALDITKPQIFEFSMSTGGKGALSAVAGQPFLQFPAGTTFDDADLMVADPLGRFILVPSFAMNEVHVLLISATGALSEAANSPIGIPSPNMVAIDPTGSFVYFADPPDDHIFVATVQPLGQLTVSTIPISPQSAPIWLVVHPNGHFLYSAGATVVGGVITSSHVETFSITPITGGLTELPASIDTSSFAAVPNMLAIDSTGSFLYLLFDQTIIGANNVGILGFSIQTPNVPSQIGNSTFANSNSAEIDQILADPFQANLYLVSGRGIFNVPISPTGSLTIPSLTVVTGTTPTTSGAISISSVP